jgi:hypothetical protein
MNKGELLNYLTDSVVRYRADWRKQIVNASHMNKLGKLHKIEGGLYDRYDFEAEKAIRNTKFEKALSKAVDKIPQEIFDAILVDFINWVGVEQGVDYGLYTKDLETHKPKWR